MSIDSKLESCFLEVVQAVLSLPTKRHKWREEGDSSLL